MAKNASLKPFTIMRQVGLHSIIITIEKELKPNNKRVKILTLRFRYQRNDQRNYINP